MQTTCWFPFAQVCLCIALYFITAVNNNNSRGAESFKINNSITYIKKSRVIKKSLIFLNENDELVIPSIDFDIRYVLIEEI